MTQEQLLSDALELTAARADNADPQSQYLIRLLLPDVPKVDGETPWNPMRYLFEGDYRVLPIKPFRVQWVRANRDHLDYDAQGGCFRLR